MDNFEQKYNMIFHEDSPITEDELELKYVNINKKSVYFFLAEIENQISQKFKRTNSMHILRPKNEIIRMYPKSKSSKIIKRVNY